MPDRLWAGLRAHISRHRALHLWLALDLAAIAAFYLLRPHTALMNFLALRVTAPARALIARLSDPLPFAVMEWLCVGLLLAALGWLIFAAVRLARAEHRLDTLYGLLLPPLCTGLAIWAAFCLLWGINCWSDGFQSRSGLYAAPVSEEELVAATVYIALQLSESADDVARDEHGAFAESRETIIAQSVHAYDAVEEMFPFLAHEDAPVKGLHFSRVLSYLDFTGMFCPFTAEPCVNLDSPACRLPCTAAHELAHRRGIFSEQECNFLGILASTTCGDAAYAYSGWMTAFIYVGNALCSVDSDTYYAIRALLPPEVEKDFADSAAYWAQFEGKTPQKVSNTVYDGVLKAWGDERGLRSYGTVTDLLVAWFRLTAA